MTIKLELWIDGKVDKDTLPLTEKEAKKQTEKWNIEFSKYGMEYFIKTIRIEVTEEKVCKLCNDKKPIDQFHKYTASSDGRKTWCIKCCDERRLKNNPTRKQEREAYGIL